MHILLATPWDQRDGGVTHVTSDLARLLCDRGHRVTFLFPSETAMVKEGTSQRGFPSLYFRARDLPRNEASPRERLAWSLAKCVTLPQLAFHAFRKNVDLVNIHYPVAAFGLTVDLARWLRVPLVVSGHGSDLFPDTGPPNRHPGILRQLNEADTIVVPSQNFLRTVVGGFPSVRDKLRCIHNGYDEREFHPASVQTTEVATRVKALFIGHLIPKKGVDVLLQALAQCSVKEIDLRILGDGQQRAKLEALISSLGLTGRVTILGFKSHKEVFEELIRCDLVVVPSRVESESFGLVALEAMACGKPVIASAVGGLPELVSDRVSGLLVPVNDAIALAGALELLAGDPELRRTMGLAGCVEAARFPVRAMCDAYESLFEQLIARNPRRIAEAKRQGRGSESP